MHNLIWQRYNAIPDQKSFLQNYKNHIPSARLLYWKEFSSFLHLLDPYDSSLESVLDSCKLLNHPEYRLDTWLVRYDWLCFQQYNLFTLKIWGTWTSSISTNCPICSFIPTKKYSFTRFDFARSRAHWDPVSQHGANWPQKYGICIHILDIEQSFDNDDFTHSSNVVKSPR